MNAQFIGVGVGPGDPELITLKAARYIQQADVICFIENEKRFSQAKSIASTLLNERTSTNEISVVMPMSHDRSVANQVYDEAAQRIKDTIFLGQTVVFLCEGDPLFFGSFSYLMERLQHSITCAVVPGISSVNAASSALKIPLTLLTESFAVVSGRHSEKKIIDTLIHYDSVVIMKAGRSREKIIKSLVKSNRVSDANYLEYIGRDNELIETDIESLLKHANNELGPYFSLFVVTRPMSGRAA